MRLDEILDENTNLRETRRDYYALQSSQVGDNAITRVFYKKDH